MSGAARRVGILGHVWRPEVRDAAARLRRALERAGHAVQLDSDLARELGEAGTPLDHLASWCRLLVSLGGDGTALTGARAMYQRTGAFLPINLGGLGFLTVAEENELLPAVRATLEGRWRVVPRRLVALRVRRGRHTPFRGVAMNDMVVRDATGFAAVHLRMDVGGADLGYMVSDGVVVATPAGSTAYSLSAGGPVVAPDLEALVVTPVCPHTLAARPLVLSGGEMLRLQLLGHVQRGVVLIDGHDRVTFERGDQLEFGLSPGFVRLIQRPDRPWAAGLRDKLGWQGSERRSV
jgi:NAD+ kinase